MGKPIKLVEWEKPVPGYGAGLPLAIPDDTDWFYPDHTNRRAEPRACASLSAAFLVTVMIFFVFFKLLLELREALLIFAISFVVGFATARNRYTA